MQWAHFRESTVCKYLCRMYVRMYIYVVCDMASAHIEPDFVDVHKTSFQGRFPVRMDVHNINNITDGLRRH